MAPINSFNSNLLSEKEFFSIMQISDYSDLKPDHIKVLILVIWKLQADVAAKAITVIYSSLALHSELKTRTAKWADAFLQRPSISRESREAYEANYKELKEMLEKEDISEKEAYRVRELLVRSSDIYYREVHGKGQKNVFEQVGDWINKIRWDDVIKAVSGLANVIKILN